MRYVIKNANNHVEVYDWLGNFIFSADTIQEAQRELEEELFCA